MLLQMFVVALLCSVLSLARAGEAASDKAAAAGEKKTAQTVRIGDLEVIALQDIAFEGTLDLLVYASPEVLNKAAKPGALQAGINAFVVKVNGRTILFDAGTPRQGGQGGIVGAMAQAGLKPADIDAIVVTHFHSDHVGGLLENGKPVFERAEVFVPRVEVDKWSDSGTEFLPAYNVRTNAVEFGREILPGVTSLDTRGHTPGHASYLIEAGKDKLLILGDLIHMGGVQFANPEVAMTFDVDPAAAVAQRRRIFDMAAERKLPIAAAHLPLPGTGIISVDGKGYAFTEVK